MCRTRLDKHFAPGVPANALRVTEIRGQKWSTNCTAKLASSFWRIFFANSQIAKRIRWRLLAVPGSLYPALCTVSVRHSCCDELMSDERRPPTGILQKIVSWTLGSSLGTGCPHWHTRLLTERYANHGLHCRAKVMGGQWPSAVCAALFCASSSRYAVAVLLLSNAAFLCPYPAQVIGEPPRAKDSTCQNMLQAWRCEN